MLPKIILVPTDFGEPSDTALDYAIELAKALGSEVVLLHAYDVPVVGFPDGALIGSANLSADMSAGAQAGLSLQLGTREGRGVTLRSVMKQGDAVSMVHEAVTEVGADLVVMGTHGRTGLPRMLLGSVAEKVVRTATVPVLTIHAEGPGAPPKEMPAAGPIAANPS